MTEQQTLAERVDELVATLGLSRKQARKALMGRNVCSSSDGVSRLSHADPTPVQAIRNIERQQRRTHG